MTVLRAGSATDVGRTRTVNQDSMLTAANLFVVADGMGGHAGGEVASSTAISALEGSQERLATPQQLVEAILKANATILSASLADSTLAGMGTTVVAASLIGNESGDALVVANVGDSRGYLFHEGHLNQITTDHSMAAEMVRQGDITEEEALTHPQRHVITRALGVDETVEVDLFTITLSQGDRVLLCSDGLTNELDDEEIESVLSSISDPNKAAADLVGRANAHGGADNITAVVIDTVVAEPVSPTTASERVVTTAVTAAPRSADPATPPPARGKEGWIARRRRLGVPRSVTFRVVFFGILVAAVVFGAWAFVRWYATSSYYVTSDGDSIVIYQGRPGGVLWFHPQLVTVSSTPVSGILPSRRPILKSDVVEPSLAAANQYIANLAQEYNQATTILPASPPTTKPPPITIPGATTSSTAPGAAALQPLGSAG